MSRNKKSSAKGAVAAQPQVMGTAAPQWLSAQDTGIVLSVHAQPGAKRDAVVGDYDGKLKIALTAPPVDGKANERLIRFLADALSVPRSAVSLITGETSRSKRLLIKGVTPQTAVDKLR